MTHTTSELRALDKQHIWHPFTQHKLWNADDPLVIVAAEGTHLIDSDGNRYLDGVSSLWCNVHGHRVAEIDNGRPGPARQGRPYDDARPGQRTGHLAGRTAHQACAGGAGQGLLQRQPAPPRRRSRSSWPPNTGTTWGKPQRSANSSALPRRTTATRSGP